MEKSNESFATVDELAKIWRPLSDAERSRAEALLLQASNGLRLIAKNNGHDLDDMVDSDTSGIYEANVKSVVMAAVQRLLAAPTEMAPDATSFSQSASPYSESISYQADSSGSIFFKTRELKLLGLGSISGSKQIGILRGVRNELD